MRDDLGRMAQHFEHLRDDEPTRPRLRDLAAGAVAGIIMATVGPMIVAAIISGGWW